VDGVSPDLAIARRTLSQILVFAEEQPLVYLPSHDPESAVRLDRKSVLQREATKTHDNSPARAR
jgi:N-acyl homoserine lactone hydrolase